MGARTGHGFATLVAVVGAAAALVGAGSAPHVASAGGELAAVRMATGQRSFVVAATGDVLTENAVLATARSAASGTGQRFDFTPLLAPIEPIISSAHLAICHMEIPIGNPGQRVGEYGRSPYGGNLLLAPYEVAAGLRDAGFDRCSTASNHSNDLGNAGIDSTLAALDAAGISHDGTARNPAEAVPDVFTVNGVRVAHLSVTRYSNTVVPNEPWRLDFPSGAAAVIADIAAVRAAGAEVVILSVHVSQELQRAPTAVDRGFVTSITAAGGVDLVIEHGPHVVQPVEQVNGTWVFWSVGNLLSGMGQPGATRYGPPTLDGLLAWAQISEETPGRFSVTPAAVLVCSEIVDRIVHPALTALADPSISGRLRGELQACLDRSRSLVPDLR